MSSMTDEGVHSSFEYVSSSSHVNLRYSGGGGEINTGIFDRQKVFIRNARREESLNFETCGFELAHHETVADLYDEREAEALYPEEIERLLKEKTGADHVVMFGAVRRHATRPHGRVFNAATDVHVDYSHYQAQRVARELLGLEREAALPYRRFMAINLWRALSRPPQDQPLAVCDARSVATQSGVPNMMIRVEELPPREAMLKEPPPDADELPHGWLFHFDPAHRWYYYPNMTRDELLLFKLYDSTEKGPWRCPHASFIDPNVPGGVPPRESYEIRSFVYFR